MKIRPGLFAAAAAVALASAGFSAAALVGPGDSAPPAVSGPPAAAANLQYHVAGCYPHDRAAFTQGLIYSDGVLYESTGLVGRSSVRRVRLSDGKVLQSVAVPRPHFGEGMTDWQSDLISITWRSGIAFRWNRKTLVQRATMRYDGEGWGLTQDGQHLILSDGSANLRFIDPESFALVRTLPVTISGTALPSLNELEWVEGSILANVWKAKQIVQIDPHSGTVTGMLDLTSLADAASSGDVDAVLNGIAYDRQGKRLFVTGKTWPWLFELRQGPRPDGGSGCAALPDAKLVTISVAAAP